jgi:Protein of unknown function (DUF3822)
VSTNVFLPQNDASMLIIDPTLENKSSGLCDLLVLAEKSSIQLSLLEKKSNRFLAFEIFPNTSFRENFSWKDHLETATSKSKILRQYEFSKARICLTSAQYTLVPEALLHPGDEQAYFKLNFKETTDSTVHRAHISTYDLFSVYSIENELQKELTHLFQDPKFIHHSEVLLNSVSRLSRNNSGKQLFLNVRQNEIDILVTEGKKLILMNTFSKSSNEDVLYYTLFVCEQLGIDPERTPFTLLGEIEKESALYKLLYTYIRKISFGERTRTLAFSSNFNIVPSHFYHTLFNLALCE